VAGFIEIPPLSNDINRCRQWTAGWTARKRNASATYCWWRHNKMETLSIKNWTVTESGVYWHQQRL